MNKHHENKLTMYLAVQTLLGDNVGKISTLPALAAPVGKFKNLIGMIETKAKEFDSVAVGKTRVKTEAEDALMEELIPAVSALWAYANASGDSLLAEKADVSETSMRRLRDTEIITRSTGVLELVEANVEKLGDYGVTTETVSSIRQKLNAYAEALGKKETGISERSIVRKTLFELFDEADAVLTGLLDPLMEQFRRKDTEFYNLYFQTRFIKDMGAARKAKPAIPSMQPAI